MVLNKLEGHRKVSQFSHLELFQNGKVCDLGCGGRGEAAPLR